MIYKFILIFILAHLLGDYYLQTEKMAKDKNNKIVYLLIHSFLYYLISFIVVIPFWDPSIVMYAVYISTAHLVIDLLKMILYKSLNKNKTINSLLELKQGLIYIADQTLHLLVIFIFGYIFVLNENSIIAASWFNHVIEIFNIDKTLLIKWSVVLLLIGKPANITFTYLFSRFKPIEAEVINPNNQKAGATIGILERLIIVILLSIGQYSAIGLILTAKSIARYNKISDNKEFGEYYLLGTLVSVLYSIIIFILIF